MPGLGYKPDHHDPRDFKFGDLLRASAPPPPRNDALRSYTGGQTDQAEAEGCVGWALRGALWTRWNYLSAQQNLPQPVEQPSAMFLWWMARKLDGTQTWNAGTYIRNATKQAAALGVCSVKHWPDEPISELSPQSNVPRYAWQPSVDAFQHAADQRFPVGYYRVGGFISQRKMQVQQALSAGFPVVLGTHVTRAFSQLRTHEPLLPPGPTDEIAGGHAMQPVCYDERGVYGPNTWGSLWGNAGWFALSWEYVLWQYTADLWAVDCALPGAWS